MVHLYATARRALSQTTQSANAIIAITDARLATSKQRTALPAKTKEKILRTVHAQRATTIQALVSALNAHSDASHALCNRTIV